MSACRIWTGKLELDIITELSPLEITSKVEQAVREAIETVKQSFGTELDYDIYLLLDGHEIPLVTERV